MHLPNGPAVILLSKRVYMGMCGKLGIYPTEIKMYDTRRLA